MFLFDRCMLSKQREGAAAEETESSCDLLRGAEDRCTAQGRNDGLVQPVGAGLIANGRKIEVLFIG